MKKILIIINFLFLIYGCGYAASDSLKVSPDDTLRLPVVLSGGDLLSGAQCFVDYDSTIIELLSDSSGGVKHQNGNILPEQVEKVVRRSSGNRIYLSISVSDKNQKFIADGSLCYLYFIPKKSGDPNIVLNNLTAMEFISESEFIPLDSEYIPPINPYWIKYSAVEEDKLIKFQYFLEVIE